MTNDTSPLIIPAPAAQVLHPTVQAELTDFRSFLDQRLVGQEEAKDEAVEILAQIRNPLRDPNKPVDSFILAGPSTVGKTELFKLLVEWVNGNAKHMLFFSGSEFAEKHQVQKLIGAPHGYIGYVKEDEVAKLEKGKEDTSALLSQHNLNNSIAGAKSTFVFILFDEWEKFHPEFNRFMLRPLREGTGELNNGRKVNFRNVIIGFTSNIGAAELERAERTMGFTAVTTVKGDKVESVRKVVAEQLLQYVPPEFRNRIGRVMCFRKLRADEAFALVDVHVKKVQSRIAALPVEQAFHFRLEDVQAKEFLLRDTEPVEGEDLKSRVAKLIDRIEKHLALPLGRLVAARQVTPGDEVEVRYDEELDALSFSKFAMPIDVKEYLDAMRDPTADGGKTTAVIVDGKPVGVVEKGEEKRSAKARKEGKRATAKRRLRRKAIMQTFYLSGFFRDEDEFEMGRQAMLATISDCECIELVTELTDYRKGQVKLCVEATVEDMLEVKDELHGWPVRITGGEL